MEKIDVILGILFIVIGIPLLFVEPKTTIPELIFSIWLIKFGILFLIVRSVIKIYNYDK